MRDLRELKTSLVYTVSWLKKRFLGPKIWEILLDSFKKIKNIEAFKRATRKAIGFKSLQLNWCDSSRVI